MSFRGLTEYQLVTDSSYLVAFVLFIITKLLVVAVLPHA
jgi:hypothetical protein